MKAKVTQFIRDHPIRRRRTNSVNRVLSGFALAFNEPTFVTFMALFTGAVWVRGRHTVTRMIFAAGVRAAHPARFHRFFSRADWRMEDLWERWVGRIAGSLLRGEQEVHVAVDNTAQKKTGAKIYGVGMVYDNRPKSQKGRDLEWGLTWVVTSVLVRVPTWKNHVFAVPILARLYRRKEVCRAGGRRLAPETPVAASTVAHIARPHKQYTTGPPGTEWPCRCLLVVTCNWAYEPQQQQPSEGLQATMSGTKLSALSAAPPTSPPSMFSFAIRPSTLSGLTLPP